VTDQPSHYTDFLLERARRAQEAIAGLSAAHAQAGGLLRSRRLPDGTVGYYARLPRTDDCWAAAVATCLQVPIEEVPDPHLDQQVRDGEDPEEIARLAWEDMDIWLSRRGLRMVRHRKLPAARRRWIGVAPAPGIFQDHCVVMSGPDYLFDPCDHPALAGLLRRPSGLRYGFSFR
jgi:hypothetical protein